MTSPRLNSNSPGSCGVKSYSACTKNCRKFTQQLLVNPEPKGMEKRTTGNSPLQAPCLVTLYPETEKQMWSDGSRPVR
jgi:hypothetical protein